MQILGPDEGALPTLPPTPILERYLFESPTVPATLLVILGLAVLIWGLKRQKKAPPMIAALVLFALALSLYFVAGEVTTPREVLRERTAELVGDVAMSDAAGVRLLVADTIRVGPSDNASGFARSIPKITGRDQLESVMSLRMGQRGSLVGSHQILETRAGLDGPGIGRTLVRVRVRGPNDAYINHSWWEIEWRQSGETWLATRIEAIWIQG